MTSPEDWPRETDPTNTTDEPALVEAREIGSRNRVDAASVLLAYTESARSRLAADPTASEIGRRGVPLEMLVGIVQHELAIMENLARSLLGVSDDEWERAAQKATGIPSEHGG